MISWQIYSTEFLLYFYKNSNYIIKNIVTVPVFKGLKENYYTFTMKFNDSIIIN